EFSVTTNSEAAEAVAELFNRYGQGGAVIEVPVDCFEPDLATAPPPSEVIVRAYLPLDGTPEGAASTEEAQQRLREGLWHLGQIYPIPDPVVIPRGEEDWVEAWKQHYHLLRVGRRIVIVPAWEAYTPEPGEAIICMEPGMAFGTGLHPTTRLCLEALETSITPGSTVLDVGTGSGVLAIAAVKLGARSVLALDADPVAISVAQENVGLNGVASQVALQHSSLPGGTTTGWGLREGGEDRTVGILETGQFDLVLVNILAKVIIGMAPSLAARLGPGGRLIAAGLIESQEEQVRGAFQAAGLQIVGRTQEQDWVCLVAQGE
ncbi:MAG: 50S ribosomal protein L11 methyltransferase, partial [Anaerolineae bacterium]